MTIISKENIRIWLERSALASASYADGVAPSGWEYVSLSNLGISATYLAGDHFFQNGQASASILQNKTTNQIAISLRGTDGAFDTLLDYPRTVSGTYWKDFSILVQAAWSIIHNTDVSKSVTVTGHSLGGAAVDQLARQWMNYTSATHKALGDNVQFFALESPQNRAGDLVQTFGFENDIVYNITSPTIDPELQIFANIGGPVQSLTTHKLSTMPAAFNRMQLTELFYENGLPKEVTGYLIVNWKPTLTANFTGIGSEQDLYILGANGKETLQRFLSPAGVTYNNFNDTIYSRDISGTRDFIDGMAGNDKIWGRKGLDYILGGKGNDAIYGGLENDTLHGGDGADLLVGDEGDDSIFGGIGSDVLKGEGGSDTIAGGDGHDKIYGEMPTDIFLNQAANDLLLGNAGNDELYGSYGNDTLNGGTGNDLIDGGYGTDEYIGGSGVDFFKLSYESDDLVGNNVKYIRDFSEHVDKIVIEGYRSTFLLYDGFPSTSFRHPAFIFDTNTGNFYFDYNGFVYDFDSDLDTSRILLANITGPGNPDLLFDAFVFL